MSYDTSFMAALLISIDRMPFLASSFNNVDPLVALAIAPGFYLHYMPGVVVPGVVVWIVR